MTCGWKLEHQPWRTPWKVARRRVCSTDEVPICGAPATWPQSGSSPRRILSNPSPCKLSSPLRSSGGALPAEMAVPFCVLLEGQASSCTEPTATWQRLNAGGGGEISYRAAVKRRHPPGEESVRRPEGQSVRSTKQEVSMAAWRQCILIGVQGGHTCIEVRLRRRGAGHVQRVRGARRRVHTSRGFSEPSTQTAGCVTRSILFGLHESSASGSMLFGSLR